MNTILITLILSLPFFILVRSKLYLQSFGVICFFLPMAGRLLPLGSWNASFVSVMVFLFFISFVFYIRFAESKIRLFNIIFPLFILLCLLSFSVYNVLGLPSRFSLLPAVEGANMIMYLTSLFAGLLIFCILSSLRSGICFHTYIVMFLLSNILLFFVFFALRVGISVPNFLNPYIYAEENQSIFGNVTEFTFTNKFFFSGFHGFVENFAEYQFLVFSLSILLFALKKDIKNRTFAICCIVISIFFGIASANRSFFVCIILFFSIIFLIDIYKRRVLSIAGLVIMCLGLSIYFIIIYSNVFDHYFLYERFNELKWRADIADPTNKIDYFFKIIGRPAIYREFWNIINSSGIFGNGPFIFWQIDGDAIPYHNTYFQILLSFGFTGIVLFILLIRHVFTKLFAQMRNTQATMSFSPISIIISMVIVLLVNNNKVSDFRTPSSIMTFFFILGLSVMYTNVRIFDSNKKNV